MASNTDIDKMRLAISQVYPNTKWAIKCQNMKPRQVVAIYLKMKEKGKFDGRRRETKKRNKELQQYHQMTLWDYGYDL